LNETAAIAFFHTPERATAELRIKELGKFVDRTAGNWQHDPHCGGLAGLMRKTWVTHRNLFVDRVACGWSIRRFVDKTAAFKFVPDPQDRRIR
jgi:hypothetical protein